MNSTMCSINLSKDLELVLGSEDVIKARQQVIAEINIPTIHLTQRFITGSVSEGMSIQGELTDCDSMLVYKQLKVYETDVPLDKFHLIYDTRFIGSVLLEQIGRNDIVGQMRDEYKNRYVISATKFKNQFTYNKDTGKKISLSGPVVHALERADFVIACQIMVWPKCALEWTQRQRRFNWPCKSLIKFIVSNVTCHVVPTYDVQCEDRDLLWRISFSRAETVLVSSLSYVQFKVFILTKLFLKYAIMVFLSEEEKFLTSYHIKNIIFYQVENVASALWSDDMLLERFWDCVDFLKTSLKKQFLPHYILPGLNLFVKRWNIDIVQRNISMLDSFGDRFSTSNIVLFAICERIKGAHCTIYGPEWKKALLDTEFVNDCVMYEHGMTDPNAVFRKNSDEEIFSEQQLKQSLCKFVQDKSITLCVINLHMITNQLILKSLDMFESFSTCNENRLGYHLSRKMKRLLLFGYHADIARGRLALAYYYYNLSDFDNCVRLCNDVIVRINKPWIFNSRDMGFLSAFLSEISGQQLGIFEKLKIANLFKTQLFYIYPREFDLEFNYFPSSSSIFTMCPYLLIFMCCFHLGNISGCHHALSGITKEVQKGGIYNASGYSCMGMCYEMLLDEFKAKRNYLKAIGNNSTYTPAITRFRKLVKITYLRIYFSSLYTNENYLELHFKTPIDQTLYVYFIPSAFESILMFMRYSNFGDFFDRVRESYESWKCNYVLQSWSIWAIRNPELDN